MICFDRVDWRDNNCRIARQIGCSPEYVRQVRKRLGIARACPPGLQPRPKSKRAIQREAMQRRKGFAAAVVYPRSERR